MIRTYSQTYGKFQIKSSRKNLNNINLQRPSPSEFLLLWTLLRYTKVREKSKILGPRKFRKPTFSVAQNKVHGPKNDCRNAEMGTTQCQLISIFESSFYSLTLEIGPGKLQKQRNPKILLRKSGEMIFQHFFDKSSAVTRFEGPLSGIIFRVKKIYITLVV